ncbi:hypothetical protein HMPREF0866_02537 [Ruminococcaceae bacterium D16]|nr:hypothetical protein HMPREF0866_02537 [Ruminococcaceae bacterium D16]
MKKKFLISAILILALLVGGILWYTRPQTFWQATGMDRDNITGASGYAVEGHVTAGQASLQTWMLNDLTPGQEDYEGLLELLEQPSYRASLENLLPPASSHPAANVTAWVSFAFADDLVTVQADYPGKVWISYTGRHSRTLVFSVSPRDLNETLADFIQQQGVAGNS